MWHTTTKRQYKKRLFVLMATLLFANDDYVYRHKGQLYIRSQADYDFYQRYLRVFERVRFVARCIDEEDINPKRIPFSKEPRIECVPVPIFHGPKEYAKTYFTVGRLMSDVVKGCDAGIFRLPSTVAMRVAKKFMKTGRPYATEVVFCAKDGETSANGAVEKMLWKIIHSDMKKVCGNANGVSCVTEHFLQQYYYSKRADAFTANYSSLSIDKTFFTAPRQYPTKPVLTIAHTANNVNFNGRKGHKELVEALRLLKDKGITVNLKFAGEDWDNGFELLGNYAKELGVEKQVEFAGFLNRQQLSDMLDESDLFVLPTRAEGLPRVIIEAMAKGLPCVSTKVSGNHELLANEYLVDYDDVPALAKSIKTLVTDKTAYEKASKDNFENSQQYEGSLLEVRRDKFYQQLKDLVK